MTWAQVALKFSKIIGESVFVLVKRPIAGVIALSKLLSDAAPPGKNKPPPLSKNVIRNPLAPGGSREVHQGGLEILKSKAGFGTIKI